MAEFALAVPLFFVLFLGLAEGGYFVVATTIVSHATHEGARYGVLDSTPALSDVRTRVQQRAAPVVSLTESAITLRLDGASCNNACYAAREPGQHLAVRTAYTHRPLVGLVFPGLTFTANAEAEMLVEGFTT
jgi:Flp pilus assembly protein TadG